MNNNLKIGEYLKTQRELKKFSCKIVSQKTKIHMTNLDRLENDDFKNLPNKAYLVGYIKSYASCLGLDQRKCLDLFNHTYNLYQPENLVEEQVTPTPKNKSNSNFKNKKSQLTLSLKGSSADNLIKIGIGITLLIVVIFLFFSNKNKIQMTASIGSKKNLSSPLKPRRSKKLHISVLEQNSKKLLKIKEIDSQKAKKIAEQEAKAKKTAAQEAKAKKTAEQEAKAKKIAEQEVNKPLRSQNKDNKKINSTIKFSPFRFPIYTYDKQKSNEDSIKLIPKKFRVAVAKGRQNVLVTATIDNSWITYQSDDKPIKKFILRKGRSILVRGVLIRMFIGNHNNVHIFLNNKLLKLTSPSDVKSLVFPEEKAKELNIQIPLFRFQDGQVFLASQENKINEFLIKDDSKKID